MSGDVNRVGLVNRESGRWLQPGKFTSQWVVLYRAPIPVRHPAAGDCGCNFGERADCRPIRARTGGGRMRRYHAAAVALDRRRRPVD